MKSDTHIYVFLSLAVLSLTVVNLTTACGNGPPCPISNGFQMECECVVVWGCFCYCPKEAEMFLGGCEAKPTHVGEVCRLTSSCDLIPGSFCNNATQIKRCACNETLVPTNDNKACIPKPTLLNEPCSQGAPCDDIPGAFCSEVSPQNFQCKCQDPLRPTYDNSTCIPQPTRIGDTCSKENPCGNVHEAICVSKTPQYSEKYSTCECPSYGFAAGRDGKRCQPTKLGIRCSEHSTCEFIQGATCQGSPAEIARCLCSQGTNPQYELTSCK